MNSGAMEDSGGLPGPVEFTTTHWSVVMSARVEGSAKARAALETLCRSYWYPLYAYVRRQGHIPADAQDLTQEFFARLLSHDFLRNVSPDKGRFRSFLLTCLKRFLTDEWRRGSALKRRAGQPVLVLDESVAEQRYLQEPAAGADPEKLYERRWALTLLDRALDRLEGDFREAGKQAMFAAFTSTRGRSSGSIRRPGSSARPPQAAASRAHGSSRRREQYWPVLDPEDAPCPGAIAGWLRARRIVPA
jgi:RNA polymerase sigma factor (sigma-70 family)